MYTISLCWKEYCKGEAKECDHRVDVSVRFLLPIKSLITAQRLVLDESLMGLNIERDL